MAGHSERPFSTLETRSRTSSFQSHASRRDREFLPFSLMLRDEIENFCLSVSCFETRSRISSLQSHASRRDREFLSFSLVLRDEIEIQLGVSGNTPRRDCGVCLKLLAPWTVVID